MLVMREGQPPREASRRFIGCLPVEGHHGCGYSWRATELSAPTVADGRDLDVVRAPANSLLEAMNRHSGMSFLMRDRPLSARRDRS